MVVNYDHTLRDILVTLAILAGLLLCLLWVRFGRAVPDGASVRVKVRYLSAEGHFLREDLVVVPGDDGEEAQGAGSRRMAARARKQIKK